MAMSIARRTFTSASGFAPSTSSRWRSSAPTFMPRKIVRFCGADLTTRLSVPSTRPMSCTGTSWMKSTSPERRAATRVAAFWIGVNSIRS